MQMTADIPTITMSRLKALVTGNLPTFLDVGESFAASQVNEDNIVEQLREAGKRLVRAAFALFNVEYRAVGVL